MSNSLKNSSGVASTIAKNKAFEFTNSHFSYLQQFVIEHTGISLSEHKRDLVYGRLTRRLRSLGLDSFDKYCALLKNEPDSELEHFSNAITTNLTSFFREKHHFEFLAETLIPKLLTNNPQRRIRIWSAGCSTGEEPYSIAITLRETLTDVDRFDIQILATDLDSNVISKASSGIYADSRVEGLPKEQVKRWFQKGTGSHAGEVRVSTELRKMITFRQLNLMHNWPMQGKFDIIFCRNVVIYFDKPTQSILFDRFANILQPQAHLFIGHSETMHKVCERFSLIGKTIYEKDS